MKTAPCQICESASILFDVVDFNKSCLADNPRGAPLSGIPVYYYLCPNCGFLFAPEIQGWSAEELGQKIYNADYVLFDPEYIEMRPRYNAAFLLSQLDSVKEQITHLDFGGGNGILCRILSKQGWRSTSFDPFSGDSSTLPTEKYNLITAYEVLEHASDVRALMRVLNNLLADHGVLLLTTSLSDGQIAKGLRLTWWYASPRNGHISIFSSDSLKLLFSMNGLQGTPSGTGVHIAYRNPPSWTGLLTPPKSVKIRIRDFLSRWPAALRAVRDIRKMLQGCPPGKKQL